MYSVHYTGFVVKCRLFLVDHGEILTWNPQTLKIHLNTNSNKFREFVTRSSRRSISKTNWLSCMRMYGRFTMIFSPGNLFIYVLYVEASIYYILRLDHQTSVKQLHVNRTRGVGLCRLEYVLVQRPRIGLQHQTAFIVLKKGPSHDDHSR